MAIQLRASSSCGTRSWKHDVFLSFRGEDTRYNFTDHLHSNLVQKGINTFIDDELTRGEEISQSLVQAIQGSKLSLIVFSENYASSKWCLDELVHILECNRSNQQKVRPVFYKVDPSDIRHQRGSFGDALANHESNFKGNMGKVLRWRTALTEAANLSGWHFSHGYESKFIHGIVEEISARVKEHTYLNVAKYPVGVESRIQEMLERLHVGGSDIRMVGIWGTGRIGKTTIAKAVYNEIVHNFEGSCFLENVREASMPHGGLVNQQNVLLSQILRDKELKVINVDEGVTLLSQRLKDKRILLVLDDVNELYQLEKLAGASGWFGRGSRIIITTRDKRLLIDHEVNRIYKARELNHHEACKLFYSNTFKNHRNLDDDEELSVSTVVKYAQGLPLALVVLGSHLSGRPIHQWQALLDGYKKIPLQGIQKILKISYDALEETVKEIFLDIACFFRGRNKIYVIQILECCDRINPPPSIEVLEEKSLINVDKNGCIWMHDLLEEMGKEIVRQESPKEPGERSRLWYHQDVLHILAENAGTSKIEGIMVKMPTTDEICLSPKCFKKMKNLKFFINVNARFCGKVDCLLEQLRFLDWPEYPFQSLPSNFNVKKLVQLNMPRSRISCLGNGFKHLQNLKSMNLKGCKFLTSIPDLSGTPNLERLDLWECTSLVEVHPSVGFLEKLVTLNFGCCSKLALLPKEVNWKSLQNLDLRFCSSLENFPEIVGEMKCLIFLYLVGCSAIKELPSSIGYLINLEFLYLENCENLTDLPCSIYQLQKLEKVWLYECPKLITFPNKVNSVMPTGSKVSHYGHRDDEACNSLWQLQEDREVNLALPLLHEFNARGCSSLSGTDFLVSLDCASPLKTLDLSGSNIVSLSECFCKFTCLGELHLRGCRNLVEISQLPPHIKFLDVRDCVSLERISKLSKILEHEESQMIEAMLLTNCCRLIKELVKEANVLVNDDYQAAEVLFYLVLSSQQSKFTITFPGSEVPKWFSYQMDFQRRQFEFSIEILPNFRWENTGLALCVVFFQTLEIDDSCFRDFEFYIHINEVPVFSFDGELVGSTGSPHVWLHYIPFLEMWRLGYIPLPPFTCRVIIYQSFENYRVRFKTCGVHLVMLPNEDVCMKLSRAENLTSERPSTFRSFI